MRSPNENNRARQGQNNNRRGRNNNNNRRNNNNNHNNNGKPQNMLTRNFDSTGPDVKIRGNAQTVAEKYTALANDAISSGSRVMAENYFQHAEHYKRIVSIATEQQAEQKAAHQAKMDAQQAEQETRRAEQEAKRAEQREQQQKQNAERAERGEAAEATPQPEMAAEAASENAPVSILENNQPSEQPSSSIDALSKALSSEPAEPEAPTAEVEVEAKPKRKRVTRPKRKPAVAKTEPTEAVNSATEATSE